MSSNDHNPLFPCTDEEKVEIREASGLTERSIREGIDSIMEWFDKQPHLVEAGISPVTAEIMMIISKGSIERAKEKIDNYYKYRFLMPEMLNDRESILCSSDKIWDLFVAMPLPKLLNNRRVFIIKFGPDITKFDIVEFFRRIFMLMDLRIRYDYMVGDLWILDMQHVGWAQIFRQNPLVFNKMSQMFTKALNWRIFGVHVINISAPASILQRVLDFFKQFVTSQIMDRVVIHDTLEDLYKYIPKEFLPEDYGGNAPSVQKLGGLFLKMDFFSLVDHDLLSDDDEEIVQYLETPFFSRRVYVRSDLFNTLRDDEFLKRFRLSKPSTMLLYDKIIHKFPSDFNRNRNAISPMNQLLCTLRYFATGSQLTACGDVIGSHESTACRILHRVTHAIANLYSDFIKMPITENEQNNVIGKFYDIAKFPRCIGAIDCTHIKILSPGGDHAEIYRNRKGYFSINTQCICSSNLLFQDVVARWHGSAHDANIWDNCAQKRNFVQGVYSDKLLVGDSGYAQTRYMMTPLPENTPCTRAEKLYQESQIRTRNVIERSFGIWKRRFPILSKGINVKLQRVPEIGENIYKSPKTIEFLLECCKVVSNESLRPRNEYSEEFLPGSFRKLEVD